MSTRFQGHVSRGVVAGVIGATALAVWFLVVDGSQDNAFRTPGLLGGALLGTGSIEPGLGAVILMTRSFTTAPSSRHPGHGILSVGQAPETA
jgi:hypothetical protein